MAEVKEILTRTTVTVVNTVLTIRTYFEMQAADFLQFFIQDEVSSIDEVNFLEGELGYTKQGMANFNAMLSDQGELIINDDSVSNYFIDSEGSLVEGDKLEPPTLTYE